MQPLQNGRAGAAFSERECHNRAAIIDMRRYHIDLHTMARIRLSLPIASALGNAIGLSKFIVVWGPSSANCECAIHCPVTR
jgi:hypothetical protein